MCTCGACGGELAGLTVELPQLGPMSFAPGPRNGIASPPAAATVKSWKLPPVEGRRLKTILVPSGDQDGE